MDDQTPTKLANQIVSQFAWYPGEKVLEPCRGAGSFYDALPSYVDKDWCEIQQGRDFFEYEGKPDTVITNPPYRDKAGGKNLVIAFLDKSLSIAQERIIFLVNHKTWHSLTPRRLEVIKEHGFGMTHLSIYSIRKWFGRYYLFALERDKPSVISWDTTNYD